MKKKTKQHGGARPGAGRKAKEDPTTTIAVRVPASQKEAIKARFLEIISTEFATNP